MKIGFIGLGTMGGRMAASLRAAGHELCVNDIRREAVDPHVAAGATAKSDAREVGEASEVIFTVAARSRGVHRSDGRRARVGARDEAWARCCST
jgi:3-hydroxyisobutyrate dehydrogenase-like beta-hydroxyacid dehydrogenase